MTRDELKKYLLEEESHAFKGWDFSYIDNRKETEEIPWNYRDIVLNYLKENDYLLDMGTGGGEFLLTLKHPYQLTSVTEAYEPNIELCKQVLGPKGITIYPIDQDDILKGIQSNIFDIVINRHESFNEEEVNRVLKKDGLFITQQVGAYNNKDLATFFDPNHKDQFPKMTLEQTVQRLEQNGFEILFQDECFPKTKFFDLGAIAFFTKIISWEFLDFSVEKNFDKFIELQQIINEKGYVISTEHRFIIVAKKIKS